MNETESTEGEGTWVPEETAGNAPAQSSKATPEDWVPDDVAGLESSKAPHPVTPDAGAGGPATSEWLAVPKAEPAPSNGADESARPEQRRPPAEESGRKSFPDRIRSLVPANEPTRGSTSGGAVSQWRRLAAGLRAVRNDVRLQKGEITRLETEIANTRAELAEAGARSGMIERRIDAEATAVRDVTERTTSRLDRLQAQLTSLSSDSANHRESTDSAQRSFAQKVEKLEEAARARAAAAKREAKRLAEETQSRHAKATAKLEGQLAEHTAALARAEGEVASKLAALEKRRTRRDQQLIKDQAEARGRAHTATVEALEKSIATAVSRLDTQVKKREPKAARAAASEAEEMIDTQLTALDQRLKKREQTTRRQFTDIVKELEAAVAAEVSEALDRARKRDETKDRQLTDALKRLAQAEAALEAASKSPSKRAPKRKSAAKKADVVKLPKGKLDANTLTFEQFRALGLSPTQTSRLIALRERTNGFSDISDLDAVVGLPAELRRTLKSRLVIH